MSIQKNIMNDSPIPSKIINSIPASSLDYCDKAPSDNIINNNNSQETG